MELELTPEEIALIQKRRAYQRQCDAEAAFCRKSIATALAWVNWSSSTGYGLTFSTFVNSFGYQDSDQQQMYPRVQQILRAARGD